MKIDKYRTSKWLKKSDVLELTDRQRQVTIDAIEEEEVGEELKPVCYFSGIKKGWPINITALDDLAAMTGSDDTDDYLGVQVEIYVDPSVSYAGKRVGGIKLRTAPAAKKPAAKAATEEAFDFDDEIPFGDETPPVEAYDEAAA